jgi:DNA-cytosine methyltransferase
MNVLSLFDGISGARISLERAGIKVDNYYASEIDKYAITISKANYPDIIQLGDITKIDSKQLPKIDLLIGGSPCQSFSFAGQRKGMITTNQIEIYTLENYLKLKEDGFQFEGQSYLFWEFIRLLKELNPTYYFLENVSMENKWKKIITKTLYVHPVNINSELLSCQIRNRFYWTNIGMIKKGLFENLESIIILPKNKNIFVKDILESDVDSKYYISEKMFEYITNDNNSYVRKIEFTNPKGKAKPLVTKQDKRAGETNYIHQPKTADIGIDKTEYRRLTPLEAERCQTLPDNYTNYVSDTQRYKGIGNGFTIEVIAYILSYLPDQYKIN